VPLVSLAITFQASSPAFVLGKKTVNIPVVQYSKSVIGFSFHSGLNCPYEPNIQHFAVSARSILKFL